MTRRGLGAGGQQLLQTTVKGSFSKAAHLVVDVDRQLLVASDERAHGGNRLHYTCRCTVCCAGAAHQLLHARPATYTHTRAAGCRAVLAELRRMSCTAGQPLPATQCKTRCCAAVGHVHPNTPSQPTCHNGAAAQCLQLDAVADDEGAGRVLRQGGRTRVCGRWYERKTQPLRGEGPVLQQSGRVRAGVWDCSR